MSNKNMSDGMFDELVASMKEAAAITKGEAKPSRTFTCSPMDIKEIRESADKSQKEFANMIGVKVGTLRNWEQGRRKPQGAALSLLRVVAADPVYVSKILNV
jgi:putative transcriptional regulator